MADTGQGTTVEFVGVGVFEAQNVTLPQRSVSAHDVSRLSDAEQRFLAGRVKINGLVRGLFYVGEGVEPYEGWEGTLRVTLPIPSGLTSPRIYTYTGFVTSLGDLSIEADAPVSRDFEFQVNTLVVTAEA